MLPPEIPIPAVRNRSRNNLRASPVSVGKVVRRQRSPGFPAQQFRRLMAGFVYGWRDDVGWRFLSQLNDVLAQIRFYRLYTDFSQRLVQVNLLRDH